MKRQSSLFWRVLGQMTNLIFKGNVDETEVGLLRTGMPMKITIGAVPEVSPTAVIEYISPKGTENSGANSFEIKAALQLDTLVSLRAGYSANAAVILQEARDVMLIPEAVTEFSGDSTFVYVRTDTVPEVKFERRSVVTGLSDGINIEVKSGIDSTAVLRAERLN